MRVVSPAINARMLNRKLYSILAIDVLGIVLNLYLIIFIVIIMQVFQCFNIVTFVLAKIAFGFVEIDFKNLSSLDTSN